MYILIITFIALQKKSPNLVTAESYGQRLAEMGDQFDDMNAKELTDMAQHASATNSEKAFRFFCSVVRNVFELGRNRLRKSSTHTCTSIMHILTHNAIFMWLNFAFLRILLEL